MKGQGYTDFQKVRLKLFPVHIKTYLLPFTNSTYTPQYYGHATDCYAGNNSHECGVLGKFIINTQGTGLRIKPSINWKTYGFNGVIANITRSYDGNYIEGYCGGQCGGCESRVIDEYNGRKPVEKFDLYIVLDTLPEM
ncbi:hypothetical protein LOTGIDRAFT_176702 [Lottia gigantea]|uniref:GON domain-containing protein n=1 Tax=Lottia gigantea TaxID=225164 RepID=V4ACV9_LOTGI|nr:hypothetical protein LOTGIDRAFT_176702 [Lottia gigantea]ESO94687.1 hypothetical protein LOTGIDRAFT_176702 [Lottia gigantea]